MHISDKIIHIICFAGLAGALSWYWSGAVWRRHFLRNIVICVILVSAYGALDEYHQSFTPGREVSFFDWLADLAGAVTGSFAGALSIFLAERIVRRKTADAG